MKKSFKMAAKEHFGLPDVYDGKLCKLTRFYDLLNLPPKSINECRFFAHALCQEINGPSNKVISKVSALEFAATLANHDSFDSYSKQIAISKTPFEMVAIEDCIAASYSEIPNSGIDNQPFLRKLWLDTYRKSNFNYDENKMRLLETLANEIGSIAIQYSRAEDSMLIMDVYLKGPYSVMSNLSRNFDLKLAQVFYQSRYLSSDDRERLTTDFITED
jgi:hypothetical protein